MIKRVIYIYKLVILKYKYSASNTEHLNKCFDAEIKKVMRWGEGV